MLLVSGLILLAMQAALWAQILPNGFQQSGVFSGVVQPVAIRFAPDGRVLIAEKRGGIKAFDSVVDTSPTVFADLNANVYNSLRSTRSTAAGSRCLA
jgi:hypothetical protein